MAVLISQSVEKLFIFHRYLKRSIIDWISLVKLGFKHIDSIMIQTYPNNKNKASSTT
ncbi:hypothetical protein SAMN05216232_2602 [Virgibacillus subterraneus]|uniref:Uncharacterized protein n=1 Tax=Virgibacillus subterraneus TaxID=621109 RepID=A0A1H9GGG4_9BACI|nr:hypothetical protein SAMN05216232_2602 [Virgibacillus subterraneus]